MSSKKKYKYLSIFKTYLHKSAYFLMIVSIIVYVFPAIFTVLNAILPGSAGGEFAVSTSSVKSLSATLCILYSFISLVPSGELILGGLTLLVALINYVWRRIRGHHFNLRYICIFAITAALFFLAYMSRAPLQAFFA